MAIIKLGRYASTMNIFDFVTQEELDDFPEQPERAFVELVTISRQRLDKHYQEFISKSRTGQLERLRFDFMSVVIAAAKRYKIEPFASQNVPPLSIFSVDHFLQFSANLDHYIAEQVIDNSLQAKRDSIFIAPKVKDRIRSHLHGLRTAVENAAITDSKKEALLRKLDDFEAELDQRRLNLLAVTRLTLEILAMPGAVWASGELTTRLVTNILQAVGEAKAEEDEQRVLGAPLSRPMLTSRADQ